MPSMTLEQAKKNETKMKETLAGLGEAPDVAAKREAAKNLRRAQRLRRRLTVEAERVAKTAAKPKSDAAPAAEAPAEESAE